MYFSISYGMLSRLLYENWRYWIPLRNKFAFYYDISFSEFNRFSSHFVSLLRAGADINHLLVGCEAGFANERFYDQRDRHHFRDLRHYDLFDGWCDHLIDSSYSTKNDSFIILQKYIQLLLLNGLSFFY